MEKAEAIDILESTLSQYKREPYTALMNKVGLRERKDVVGAAGRHYSVEIEVVWDGRQGEDIRIIGCIDDGGIRAIVPLRRDFIVERS